MTTAFLHHGLLAILSGIALRGSRASTVLPPPGFSDVFKTDDLTIAEWDERPSTAPRGWVYLDWSCRTDSSKTCPVIAKLRGLILSSVS